MQYAQHIHVVTIPVHSLYYITSYTKKYGSGQPNTDIKLPHLLQETGAISKSRASHLEHIFILNTNIQGLNFNS